MDRRFLAAAAAAFILLGGTAARADVVDEWTTVKLLPPPQLKEVTVDPKTTALLMMDFLRPNCGARPRCLATIPTVKKLLGEARNAKAPVIHTFYANFTVADLVDLELAPKADEPNMMKF
jgi:hypothetical protein